MSTRGHHGLLFHAADTSIVSRLDFTSMPDGTAATDDTGKSWSFHAPTGSVAISGGKLVTAGGGYIMTPDAPEWNFGADEFCIEAIVKLSAKFEKPIIAKWSLTSGGERWFCGCGVGGVSQAFYINASPDGASWPTGPTPGLGTVYHMAWYRRAEGGFYMSLGGSVAHARGDATFASAVTPITVGALDFNAGGMGMELYQLRVRRGPGTAYPATNFTPPSSI